ncbi:MAG: ComF family protein [Desulfamplus sp.]|nr:ComF family protein [Desulfamplus sp.]MBF0390666.1 ComF family protein [Desulfamplus sp.]
MLRKIDILKVVKLVIDAIFPPTCLKCRGFLTTKDIGALNSSFDNPDNPFEQFSKYFCENCLDLKGCYYLPTTQYHTKSNDSLFDSSYQLKVDVHAASTYKGVIRDAIHLLKYNGKIALAQPLGDLLFRTFMRYYDDKPVDLIVPIPLYWKRLFERGFNQSFLILRDFKKYWFQSRGCYPNWEINPFLLVRQRNTKSQTGFNREERQKNVKGAFAVRKKYRIKDSVRGKNIVIVDDVHTTGATTKEAAKSLFDAGAASVGIIVIAQV